MIQVHSYLSWGGGHQQPSSNNKRNNNHNSLLMSAPFHSAFLSSKPPHQAGPSSHPSGCIRQPEAAPHHLETDSLTQTETITCQTGTAPHYPESDPRLPETVSPPLIRQGPPLISLNLFLVSQRLFHWQRPPPPPHPPTVQVKIQKYIWDVNKAQDYYDIFYRRSICTFYTDHWT